MRIRRVAQHIQLPGGSRQSAGLQPKDQTARAFLQKALPVISAKTLTYNEKEQKYYWTSPMDTTVQNKPTVHMDV